MTTTTTKDHTIRRRSNSFRRRRFSIRYRFLFATLFFLLCIPFFFYHMVPSFTSATDKVIAKIFGSRPSSGGEFCTREIGNFACCTLYLEAMPCMDECRASHVDCETPQLKEQYEACENGCLSAYNSTCGGFMERQQVELALRGV